MAKTKEELNQLTNEVEALGTKLNELTDDELKTVVGGFIDGAMKQNRNNMFMFFKTIAAINDIELEPGEIPNNIQSKKDEVVIVAKDAKIDSHINKSPYNKEGY